MPRRSRWLRIAKWAGTLICIIFLLSMTLNLLGWYVCYFPTSERNYYVGLFFGGVGLCGPSHFDFESLSLQVAYWNGILTHWDQSALTWQGLEANWSSLIWWPAFDDSIRFIPCWIPLLLFGIPTIWLWQIDGRRARDACRSCRSDLTGNTTGVCPNCGAYAEPPAMLRRRRRRQIAKRVCLFASVFWLIAFITSFVVQIQYRYGIRSPANQLFATAEWTVEIDPGCVSWRWCRAGVMIDGDRNGRVGLSPFWKKLRDAQYLQESVKSAIVPAVLEEFWTSRFGGVRLPLWIPLATCALLTWRLWSIDRRRDGWCRNCRYNLTGNTSGTCPECGTPVVHVAQVRRTKRWRIARWLSTLACLSFVVAWLANRIWPVIAIQWDLDSFEVRLVGLVHGEMVVLGGYPIPGLGIPIPPGMFGTPPPYTPQPIVDDRLSEFKDYWSIGRVPLWLPLFLTTVSTIWFWQLARAPRGHCRHCEYNLTGNTSGTCPECGTPVA